MAIAANDIIRVAARINVAAVGDFVNVFHFKAVTLAAGGDSDTIDDLLGHIDLMYDVIAPNIPEQGYFIDINLFNVTQSSPIGTYPWPTQTQGEGAGNMLAGQLAAFIRGTTGRSRIWGRKFIGPCREEDNTSTGLVSSGFVTNLITFATSWISSYTGTNGAVWRGVVFCQELNQWLTMTDTVVKNVWGTMRRRRLGRGS